MTPSIFVIIDDREAPATDLERLIGNVHFGDLIRRRRRYADELVAAATEADESILLRSDEDAERLIRQIETARGETLWLRLPTVIAPLDISCLDLLIGKLRFALEPVLLADVSEDDAPMLLFPSEAIDIVSSEHGNDRRSRILAMRNDYVKIPHELDFVDLRQADGLRQFLSGATEARDFNKLTVEHGVFKKSSSDVAKMKAEHDFFSLAPPMTQRFLLPTFGYEEKNGIASYRMEHLRIPDAALQFVLGAFTEADLNQLLDQFFAYIDSREREVVGRPAVQQKGRSQILEKLRDRLDAFGATEEGAKVDALLASSGVADGLAGLRRRAEPLIESALSDHTSEYIAFSHGDPCFSNILFDSRTGLIRLVDPRGASIRDNAFMHPLYDVAKFSHSVCGGYDFINNDQFSIEVSADLSLNLRRSRDGTPPWVREVFRARLEAEGWHYGQVRAIEASLFLSMLPLHRDHPRKLLAFALIARDIIDELERHS